MPVSGLKTAFTSPDWRFGYGSTTLFTPSHSPLFATFYVPSIAEARAPRLCTEATAILSHGCRMNGNPAMPASEQHLRGQRAAGFQLWLLLSKPGPYRDMWEAHAHDASPSDINQAAVCKVIADHLYETGERADTDTRLARALKDKVSRALTGKGLALETLRWLKDAFGLSPHDAQRVDELYRGDIPIRAIVGHLPPPDPASGIKGPDHETTLLFEHHVIGRDGLPARHHSQQTIRAVVDGLTSYKYRIDTPDAEVRVRRGGTAGEIYAISGGYYAVDIAFPHPLCYGEERYMDYWTIFHYSQPPPSEFRRGTHQRVEHLDMRVEFHERKLPSQVWWAEWQDYRDVSRGLVDREAVSLDEERSAHKYLEAIEHTVVGFYWKW
jgi:hypothetical protein